MRPIFLAFFIFLAGAAPCGFAAVDPEVEARLRELEGAVEENRLARFGADREVRSFLNTHLSFGGFSETGIHGIFQRDHQPQAAVTSTALGLNVGAEFSESLHLATQLISLIEIPIANPHDDPRHSTTPRRSFGAYSLTNVITQAYLEWERSEAFRVQGGIGYAPFGVTFQQLEPVLYVRRGGPQMLRSGGELVHALWQGMHVRGQFGGSLARWGYNAYTFSPAMNTKMLGLGSRLWLELLRGALGAGLSSQTFSRGKGTFTTVGSDIRWRAGRLTLTGEIAKSYGVGEQPWSFHLEPDLDVYGQAVLIYIFGDYLERVSSRTGSLPAPFRKWEYGAGANWLPTSFTRLRLGLAYNDYVGSYVANPGGRDYWLLDLSAGVAF